jgi:iron(III) transport system ATP-binding protein
LEQQNSGEIIQAGKNISGLPPRHRDFGIVFQSYALFPNLTARDNIAYGLENRKVPKKRSLNG